MASEGKYTAFGETVNVYEEMDALYCQLVNILNRNPDFSAALDRGELDEAATTAIAEAFDEVFERNRRLANVFLSDKDAREQVTRFWFSRCYAEVQANSAYNNAFRKANAALSSAGSPHGE